MDYPKNIVILLIFLNLGTSVLSVTVTVQPSQYYITEGKNATLKCIYTLEQGETVDAIEWFRTRGSMPRQKILKVIFSGNTPATTWYQDFSVNDPISNQGRGSFLGTLGANSATIQISNIVAADDAEYGCFAEATTQPPGGQASSQIVGKTLHLYLNILPTMPSITLSNGGIVDLFPGDTVNMTCTGNVGRPTGRLRWEESFGTDTTWTAIAETSNQITANHSDGTSTSLIEYSKTFDTDSDIKFRCLADRQSYGLLDEIYSKVVQFTVEIPSGVTNRSMDVTAKYQASTGVNSGTEYKVGDQVELICNAAGHPTPTVKWSKGGQDRGTNSTLILGEVKVEDSGTYLCVATNEISGERHTAEKSVTITIVPADVSSAGVIAAIVIAVVLVVGIVIGVLVYVFVFRNRRKGTSKKDTENGTSDPSKATDITDTTKSDIKEIEYDNPVLADTNSVDLDEKKDGLRYADLDLRMREEDKNEKPKRSESPVEYAYVTKPKPKQEGTPGTSV